MANCTECISYIPDEKVCGRGIKISIPERTLCRKYLKHTVASYGDGRETHYLQNANGKMFDVTDQVLGKSKKTEGKQ